MPCFHSSPASKCQRQKHLECLLLGAVLSQWLAGVGVYRCGRLDKLWVPLAPQSSLRDQADARNSPEIVPLLGFFRCPRPAFPFPFSWGHFHHKWLEHTASSQALLPGNLSHASSIDSSWASECLSLRFSHLHPPGREAAVRMSLQLPVAGENEADPRKATETSLKCCSPASGCPEASQDPSEVWLRQKVWVRELSSASLICIQDPSWYSGVWRALKCWRSSPWKKAVTQTVPIIFGAPCHVHGLFMGSPPMSASCVHSWLCEDQHPTVLALLGNRLESFEKTVIRTFVLNVFAKINTYQYKNHNWSSQ